MENRKKKILFIIWSYTYGGGAEALLTMIANNLDPQKYDVSIIEYHHAEIKTEPVNDSVHVLPPIEAVPTPENRSKTWQLYNSPEVLIDTYIKKDYDLYVSFNYLIPTFLLPTGTKNISWLHGDMYNLEEEEMLRERRRQDAAFYKVDRIVVISDNTERSMRDLFPDHMDKVVKIYNGIDTDKIRRMALGETPIRLEGPSLLFVGRLDENKNPARLVRVLKLVHKIGIRAHLYFMGRGDEEQKVLARAKEEGLTGFVHLLGYQQNPYPVIRQCDVVCLLSKSEGFSVGLLEAVSLEKPFITSRIGGAAELSDHGSCGTIIETDEEAAEAVCALLKRDKEEIAAACRKSIMRFELSHYIGQIETLFDEVMGEEADGVKKQGGRER